MRSSRLHSVLTVIIYALAFTLGAMVQKIYANIIKSYLS